MSESLFPSDFWLTKGITWKNFTDYEAEGHQIPHASDLKYVPIFAFGLIVVRFVYERNIGEPIAAWLGVKNKVKKTPEHCSILESHFQKNKKLKQGSIDGLLSDLGIEWNQKRIEIWYRKKRNLNAQAMVPKFCETFWRLTFYIFIYVVGSSVVYNSECFWDNYKCWESYPRQTLDFSIKFYYLAELSFYLSLILTIFTDTKRKDFVEQVVHHFATILLLSLSYCVGYFRTGVLIMWLHDVSDVFLESAKLCIYAKKTKFADVLFGIFAVSFLIGRIIYFPFWIMHTTLLKPWSIADFELFPGYYVFNSLLFILLGLHIFWFYLIVDMALKLVKGSDINDSRSEDEEVEDEKNK